ncbi:MAG: hypothetical protein JNK05_05195 [Myxococcales bacterium]|nr:hypothetical protein [Myxococcales bacterium]
MLPFQLVQIDSDSRECRRCLQPVPAGFAFGLGRDRSIVVHLDCALDASASHVIDALRYNRAPFIGRSELEAQLQKRFEAERDANRQTKGKDKTTIEPLKDKLGRPSVRVLYLQSQHSRDGGDRSFIDVERLCDFWHVRSSLREYTLVEHEYPKHLRLDPAKPIAAAMYWQQVDGAVSNGNNKLVEWKALGLAAPVLVVVGASARDEAVRDNVVAKLRALLGRCGFEPDDAPVVTVVEPNKAALESLALALDEQAAKCAPPSDKRKSGRVFEAIQELFDTERDDGLTQAFVAAFKRFGRSRAEERERVLELLVKFARRSPDEAAKVIVGVERYGIAMGRAVLAQVIEGLLLGPKVQPQLGRWLARWRDEEGERTNLIEPLLRAAIERGDARKSKKLREIGVEMGFLSEA